MNERARRARVDVAMIRPRKEQLQSLASPRITVVLGGITASLLIHGLLLTPLLWGGHAKHRDPNTEGSAASQHQTNSAESMTVYFLTSRAIQDPQDEHTELARFFWVQPRLSSIAPARIPDPDLKLDDAIGESAATEANGQQQEHALLFGRYMGQISARIERAWLRPRSMPKGGGFTCRAQITQDRHGNVQEVTLEQCTEDPRWQISLVQAINMASPLPVPPDPAVFSNLVTMQFDSAPYVAGSREDGFEAAVRTDPASVTVPNAGSNSPAAYPARTLRLRPNGSIDLTIIGSQAPREN